MHHGTCVGPSDKEWLDALNLERRKNQLDPLSYEAFEIIIDRLEKEWFDLVSRSFTAPSLPYSPFLNMNPSPILTLAPAHR